MSNTTDWTPVQIYDMLKSVADGKKAHGVKLTVLASFSLIKYRRVGAGYEDGGSWEITILPEGQRILDAGRPQDEDSRSEEK